MSATVQHRPLIAVRGRSLMALVLVPEAPLLDWLAALDEQLRRAPGFFDDRAVILDLAGLPRAQPDLEGLAGALAERGIRVIGTEGAHPSWTGLDAALRPLRANGRSRPISMPPPQPQPAPVAVAVAPPPAASILIDRAVRSGQSVSADQGDLVVVGAVASGAEIVAAGSIHVYGALRGRAMAGMSGDADARIFCRRLEAELVAVGGVYLTADQIAAELRGRAVQIRRDGDGLSLAPLD